LTTEEGDITMVDVADELRQAASSYRSAILSHGQARIERDEAKRLLKDLESEIFAEKVQLGTIDGKNAETRDAQAQLAYKANTRWQAASDRYVTAEKNFQTTQDNLTITLMELRVAATLVNVEIAKAGADRLLAEVSLAGV
jgi:hypothetical protein